MVAFAFKPYLDLCKPKVVLLLLITAIVGALVSVPEIPNGWVFFWGILGIGLCSGGSAAINHLLEVERDKKMSRTENRPLPQQDLSTKQAWVFTASLIFLGALSLGLGANILVMVLTLFGLVGYSFIYTLYLKPRTPQNIVIGGLPGAIPPLLGWCAITGTIDPAALWLTAIVYLWTPAHFWALAIDRVEDYRNANVPMLPVTHGIELTRLHIFFYGMLTMAATMLYFAMGHGDHLYLLGVIVLNIPWVIGAIRLLLTPENYHPLRFFSLSNWYLMCLFIIILLDHWFPINSTMLASWIF